MFAVTEIKDAREILKKMPPKFEIVMRPIGSSFWKIGLSFVSFQSTLSVRKLDVFGAAPRLRVS